MKEIKEDSRRSHVTRAVDLLRDHHEEIRRHFEGRRITEKEYKLSLASGAFRHSERNVHYVDVDGRGIRHGLNQDKLMELCNSVNDSSKVLGALTRHSSGVIVAAFQASPEILRIVHDALPEAEKKALHLSLNQVGDLHSVVASTPKVFTTFYLAVLDHERKQHSRHSPTTR